jgi:hypothetical protein
MSLECNEPEIDELGGEISIETSSDSIMNDIAFDDGAFGNGGNAETLEASIDDSVNEEINLELSESPELEELRENGAVPFTAAPEDTSYLDEESPESGPFEASIDSSMEDASIDLSGAVIDEPDLSGELKENPVEEPSLENISIDLDLDEDFMEEGVEEDLSLEIPEEEAEETVETSPEEESFAQVIPEGFVVESDDSLADDSMVDDVDESIADESIVDESIVAFPDQDEGLEGTGETSTGEIQDFSEDLGGPGVSVRESSPKAEAGETPAIPANLKQELKTVLSYMDQLLESLPEEKIEEFAKSEYFDTYKKLFEELGLG